MKSLKTNLLFLTLVLTFLSYTPIVNHALVDTDGDGIEDNFEDLDSNMDLENDDTDADGTPDYQDEDDDGDGVLTIDEDSDPNMDGNPEDALDTDEDGVPDYLDNDDDGDGVFTEDENLNMNGDYFDDDSDADGIPNFRDEDDDGDGVLTIYEGATTQNTDATPSVDYLDDDDDDDGILTQFEYADPNGDGNPADAQDFDEDMIPNYLDMDTDYDTIFLEVDTFLLVFLKVGTMNGRHVYETEPGDIGTYRIFWFPPLSQWQFGYYNLGFDLFSYNSSNTSPDPPCYTSGIWEAAPSQIDNLYGNCIDVDTDEDGILDKDDNCKFIFNPGQQDSNNDGEGDVCDDETNLVEIEDGALYIRNSKRGIILKGQDGFCYRIFIDPQGNMQHSQITCPEDN